MTDPPTLRFAVAAFDTWVEVQTALHALSAGGKALNDVSYLGLGRVLGQAVTRIPGKRCAPCIPWQCSRRLAARQDRLRIAWLAGSPRERRR